MTVTTSKRAEIEQRRKIVAANLQSGLSITKIAEALGVSKATVSADAKAIYREWKADRNICVDAILESELSRLDRALAAIWPSVCKGHLTAIDRMLRIQERRAKYLGLDAPTRIQDVSNLSDEELRQLLSA